MATPAATSHNIPQMARREPSQDSTDAEAVKPVIDPTGTPVRTRPMEASPRRSSARSSARRGPQVATLNPPSAKAVMTALRH